MADAAAESEPHRRDVARGAVVNVLGTAGKAMIPVFYVLVARLFGPATLGVYYLAVTMIEVANALSVSGFSDGVLMFASRSAGRAGDPEAEDRLYRAIASGFLFTVGISALLIVLAHLGGPELLLRHYPQPGLLGAVQAMAWSLPLIGIPTIVIAATKALLIMRWDAILLGFVRPLSLIVLALVAWLLDAGLDGLVRGFVATQGLVAAISLAVFGRYFSWRRLLAELARFRLLRELAWFALPQNLNMTFNQLIGNLDLMVLGAFGFAPEALGFYGMASQIARQVRQAKLAFSTAYAPVIARYHGQGNRAALSESFTTVARWTTIIGLPIALAVAVVREDLLGIFHPSFVGDSTFMLLLLVAPVLSCSFGIAGNIVVMTGHSLWNLANSLFVAGLNLLLLWLLVPQLGMFGAALASLAAATVITGAQLVEAAKLAGARLVWSDVYKPFAAGAGALAAVFALSLAGLDAWLPGRIAVAAVAVAVFTGLLWLQGLDPRDRDLFRRRRL
jgi:O-antigen/teichoic acid export membrane protein